MEKSAVGGVLKGFGSLVRNGVWKTVANKSKAGGGWNRLSRVFHNPNVGKAGEHGWLAGKSTPLSKGLQTYGWAGMAAPLTGVDLPGSHLAFNATMPGLGALMSAPGPISALRMRSQKNKDKLQEDLSVGARQAGGDLMSLTRADPRFAHTPGLYQQFMKQEGSPEILDHASRYTSGRYQPLSKWNYLQSLFTDSQDIINDRVDQKIHGMMGKSGKLGAAKAVWGGLKKAWPWTFPAIGAGVAGHALLRDKPYNVQAAQERGYAGAQSTMQTRLNSLSPFERMALRFDPSILGGQLENRMPGTIGQWEQTTGNRHQPGWLSKTIDSWKGGGKSNYYQYDDAGKRHYV